ncbi:MAG: beta strand repeat-containing protein, partial [Sphingorhabdus sp.]
MTNFRKIALSASTFLAPIALAAPAFAQSLPTGGNVAAGTATIGTPTATSQTVTQTSNRAVVNWTSFNVANGNSVIFVQPDASAATLNRVTGTTGSTIAGLIQANGSVYLINPNGIQITNSGTVNVGRGFVASSLDITNDDFMADRNIFNGVGGIVNTQGSITSGTGGFVGLLGGEVQAGGTIVAPAGTVTIGTSTRATLDLNGGNFLQVALPSSAALAGNGSMAALNADAARAAVRHMVNLPASVEATAVSGTNGDVTLSGSITAAGGNVNVSAMGDIAMTGSAAIDVRSATVTGGSTVTLRSDAIGTGSGTVSLAAGSTIRTSASGAVDIYYNPSSYASPTNYSVNVVGGSGPLTAWMLVNNVNQLQAMDTNLAGTYALGRDVDASVTATWNGGLGFSPVGNVTTRFTGRFDGQEHVISGLTTNRLGQNFIGLFGSTALGSLIRNVGLQGVRIAGNEYVGGLVGEGASNISNAYVTGEVSGRSALGGLVGRNSGNINNAYATITIWGTDGIGGLVGSNFGNITNSYATGSVSGRSSIGGLVGSNFSMGNISNAYATSAVWGTSIVGGLAGWNEGSISNVYATGAVVGSSDVGGLVGQNLSRMIVSNAYWDSYSTGQTTGCGSGACGTVFSVTSNPAQSGAANYAFRQSAYANLNFTNTWFMVDGSTRPFLRSEYSTNITNSHQLQLMAMNQGANYTLARDIDMTETARVIAGNPGSYSGMWSSAGFSPVGNYTAGFTGQFDGQGHVISNLNINRPLQRFVGLFGVTGMGSVVRNIRLQGGHIAGENLVGGLVGSNSGSIVEAHAAGVTVRGGEIVGGLVGLNNDSITHAQATGSVTGFQNIGGLVGLNNNIVGYVHATGTVTGIRDIGGLAGTNRGQIFHAYSAGVISGGSSGTNVGGLVGQNNGSIGITYATGPVSGGNDIGGLVGRNAGLGSSVFGSYATGTVVGASVVGGLVGSTDSGRISDTYATGAISGSSNVGGLLGFNNATTVTNSYWDTQTTGQSTSAGGTGLTTAQMRQASSFAGWSMDTVGGQNNVWRIYEGNTAPLLKVFLTPVTVNAATNSAVYNGTLQSSSGAFSFTGNPNMALILGTATHASGTNAGTYHVGNGLYSTQQGYDLIGGSFTINRAPLTITGATGSTVYNGLAQTNGFSVAGLFGSDSVTGVAGRASGTNVGSYADALSGATGSGLSNYDISYINGALSITARPIVVTADALTRIYGDSNPALTYAVGGAGLVNGDTLTGALATSAGVASNVGSYAITQGTLAASPNYALTYVGANLSVTPRALSVLYTANAVTSTYGNTIPTLTGAITSNGLVNGDTLTGTASWATPAGSTSNIGSYGITGSGLTASSNYALTSSQAAGNASALGITARPIVVTADALTR